MWNLLLLLAIATVNSERWNNMMINDAEDGDRIIGGKPANIEDFPHQINMIVNNAYFCGGFIVSDRYIITAAHCAQDVDPKTVVLRVGSSFRSNGTEVPIAEVTPHPQYNSRTFDKDVAVLKTVDPISFNERVRAIKLPRKYRPLRDDSKVVVSGWGRTKDGAPTIPERLMFVEISVVNQMTCRAVYPSSLNNNKWCGGNFTMGGDGGCQGDSGGAAVQDGMAIGIVSYGRVCGQRMSPTVFANVAAQAIRDFITMKTGL